jgi:hypothetical protein
MIETQVLLDLLRIHRELRPHHVIGLLSDLPRQLDEQPGWIADSRPLVMRVFLKPRMDWRGTGDWRSLPLDTWGPVTVHLVSADGDVTALTTASIGSEITIAPRESIEATAVERFAVLLYELLGGRLRPQRPERLSALTSIGALGNEVLRAAILETSSFATCCALWVALLKALESEQRRVPAGMVTWRSDIVVPKGCRCDTLEFVPSCEDAPTIRIVAGRPLTLGRSRSQSDLPLHAWSEGRFSPEKTKLLSRVHVTWKPGEGFFDGYNHEPSANGSTYEEHRLSTTEPVPVRQHGLLRLGPEYDVRVTAMNRPGMWPWIVDNEAADPVYGDVGMLTFEFPQGSPILRETIWIAREVGWSLGPNGRLLWGMDPRASSGWIVHWSGGFVLANHHFASEELDLDGKPVFPGTVFALKAGQILRTGTKTWRVESDGER